MSDWQAPDTDPIVNPGGWKAPDTDPIAPQIGPVEAAGRAALNNFPFAKQGAAALAPINPLADKSNYSDELEHLTQEAQQAKVQNPKAYGAGAVLGAGAPLAIPFVGEAMEAAPLATNAALGAASGMSDIDLKKNLGEAAKQGVEGV